MTSNGSGNGSGNGTTAEGAAAPAPWSAEGLPSGEYDVFVMGGGLAGLCLALQLVQDVPGVRVGVADRAAHPAPDAAFKVGESSSEIAEWYWTRTLGLTEVMANEHIRKLGLRYFMPSHDNRRIEDRVEIGSRTHMFSKTYQIDRGRMENRLAEIGVSKGVEFYDRARITDFTLDGEAGHTVTVSRDGESATVAAKWVVDASGWRGLIKRKLGLAEPSPHDVNAVWWRLGETIEVDDFSDDVEWLRRVPGRDRWQSTVHLMDRGYWVWLIPLSSGSISVGIVADPRWVPYEEIATFEKSLAWLRVHEPQLADAVEAKKHTLQDFHGMKHFSHSTKRVFSPDRWACTGPAGFFHDPLYSPGSDFIGLANNYIVDMIKRDRAGEPDLADRVERANAAFLRLCWNAMPTWLNQYGLMGSSIGWTAKAAWDTLVYFNILAKNFIAGGTYDLDLQPEIGPTWMRFHRLNHHMQWFLRRWDELDDGRPRTGMFDMDHELVRDFNSWLLIPVPKSQLKDSLQRNLQFMETLAVELMAGAAESLGMPVAKDEIDPYQFGLGATEPDHEGETYWHEPLPRHHLSDRAAVHARKVFALPDLDTGGAAAGDGEAPEAQAEPTMAGV